MCALQFWDMSRSCVNHGSSLFCSRCRHTRCALVTGGQTCALPICEVGDIVVTAQKRSGSLQKVPLAITAITSSELERSGIRDLQGVAATVPGLNLGEQLGVAKISLRGIGLESLQPGAEGSIAFHVDGVFISRSVAALASFYDIQQVEVLRGPQGTLYGRNATGGRSEEPTRAEERSEGRERVS